MKEKLKLSDFPEEKEYPFGEEVINDVMDNFLCIPKDSKLKGISAVKCDKDKLMKTETYIIKDRQEYRKFYENAVNMAFGLSNTAMRVLLYVMFTLQQKSDSVDIVPKHCMDKCGFKTLKSVRDGIIELLGKHIIAKTNYPTKYWVNPVVLFNGDRIDFVRSYIYKGDK